jgi:eukaryotic-like serine/threonine-protein kinase
MALSAGTRLGPYEILSVIGAGGMGQVYRARDTNLKRDVAIKALLPAVAPDPDRLARFIREARILASLNHPNIALIHGVEETNGIRVFVMELIEGPTLAERSAQGPIPIGEALAIARQITDALEAAHEQGIVHRDLKPANVKLRRDGTVKVLDFGIAKTLEPPAASPAAADRANASTTTAEVRTHSGVVFGTAAYMSPEHLAGLAVDKRTDIWAFGCVLFEMLTGRAAFTGATLSEVRDAILDRDPDWSRLPAATPLPVVRLLHRCVVKDRKGRLADASDARLEIDDAINGTAHANVTGRANGAGRRGWVLAGGTGIAAGALIAAAATSAVMRDGQAPRAISRFTIVPPAAQSLDVHDNDRNLALSPDGRYLVYRSGGSTNGGPLMLRVIDSLDAQPLAGVTNARGAFFSFDSRSVGFFDRTQIRRMPLTGEPATTICTFADFFPRGATWGDDNTIVFATSDDATGLWRVPATGGTPVPLTTPDRSQQESDHLFPSMLPGGRGVLFTIAGLGSTRAPAVAVLDFQNGQRHTLIPGGSQAEYVGPPSESRRPSFVTRWKAPGRGDARPGSRSVAVGLRFAEVVATDLRAGDGPVTNLDTGRRPGGLRLQPRWCIRRLRAERGRHRTSRSHHGQSQLGVSHRDHVRRVACNLQSNHQELGRDRRADTCAGDRPTALGADVSHQHAIRGGSSADSP